MKTQEEEAKFNEAFNKTKKLLQDMNAHTEQASARQLSERAQNSLSLTDTDISDIHSAHRHNGDRYFDEEGVEKAYEYHCTSDFYRGVSWTTEDDRTEEAESEYASWGNQIFRG